MTTWYMDLYVIILDAIIQVPRPIIHIIRYYPFFCLVTFTVYIYESWYYSLCVVVYGMNIMMHIESTNYCMLSYFWSSKFTCIFQIIVFNLLSGYCCSYGIPHSLILLLDIDLLNLLHNDARFLIVGLVMTKVA